MVKNKLPKVLLILAILLLLCISALQMEKELTFEQVGSFEWINPITADSKPFGTLWWSLTQEPESYISLDTFADLYLRATGMDYTTTYDFDFQNYTYIVVAGHDLQSISYNHWDIWGRFTAKYPWYHGKVTLLPSENPHAINIYRIERMLITSDQHARGSVMDSRIVILQ